MSKDNDRELEERQLALVRWQQKAIEDDEKVEVDGAEVEGRLGDGCSPLFRSDMGG